MLIDRYMPTYDVAERHAITASASPAEAYRVLRRLDLGRAPLVRLLLILRGLPLLVGRRPLRRAMTLDDFVRGGFVILADDPGRELVLGVVGRFWRPTGKLIPVRPDVFAGLRLRGYAKAAWNFRFEPEADAMCVVSTETRVVCMDAESRMRFQRYWRVVGPFSGLIRRRMLALVKAAAERSARASRLEAIPPRRTGKIDDQEVP